ncbi:MAG: prepilin peptidase [Alphaproteobacteria bacterium]|nr:prepilin peptidase [Alphaproteobacteria bacterium]
MSLLAVSGPVLLAAAVFVLLLAGASDLAARKVPNALPLALAAIGIALQAEAGDLAAALKAAFAVFVAGYFCWGRGWFGGGDVKLLAAAALLVAPDRVPGLILCIAVAGGALALLYLLLQRVLPAPRAALRASLWARVLRIEQWRIRRRGPLPYASAIVAGALTVLLTP